MSVRIVQLGSPRHPDEGTRIGTVRRPPRGVPKSEFATRDYYDVWLPLLSPEPETIKQAQAAADPKSWKRFIAAFERELARPEAARTLELLAKLSHTGNFSVGCYCENAARCHRSVLESRLRSLGAKFA
jgi:uncharacterized protein YeaO (DUF488 family)